MTYVSVFQTYVYMAIRFEKDEKFSSLSDLETKIVQYQRKKYGDLYQCDSRTIDSAIKKKSISADKRPSEEKQGNRKEIVFKENKIAFLSTFRLS